MFDVDTVDADIVDPATLPCDCDCERARSVWARVCGLLGMVVDVVVVDAVGVVFLFSLLLPVLLLLLLLLLPLLVIAGGIWVDVGRSVVAEFRFVTLDFARPWTVCRGLDVVDADGRLDDVVVRTELLVVPVDVVDTVVATDACRALPKGLPVAEVVVPPAVAFSTLVVGLALRPATLPLPVYKFESGGLLPLLVVVDVLVARFLPVTVPEGAEVEAEVGAVDETVDDRARGFMGSLLGEVFLCSLLLLVLVVVLVLG